MKKDLSFCVFANFLINTEERFQRLKDSFQSFQKICPDEWILNIRGSYKYKVANYFEKNIKTYFKLSFRNSKKGWLKDSKFCAKSINSELVMLWIEDHLLVSDLEVFKRTLQEINNYEIDLLEYSWFQKKNKEFFYSIPPIYEKKYLDFSFCDQKKKDLLMINKKFKDNYLISMQSIMRKSFFLKILDMRNPTLKRWPKNCPFDFEKKIVDCRGLNFKVGFPKNELFVSIDDDHDEVNYSLISRGLYPQRMQREELKVKENGKKFLFNFFKRIFPNYLFNFVKNIYIFFKRINNTIGYFI